MKATEQIGTTPAQKAATALEREFNLTAATLKELIKGQSKDIHYQWHLMQAWLANTYSPAELGEIIADDEGERAGASYRPYNIKTDLVKNVEGRVTVMLYDPGRKVLAELATLYLVARLANRKLRGPS